MLAALAAVPFLIQYLGQERLGVLSLIWVVVGYFSFLDMGLGRAVTVAVARCRSSAEPTGPTGPAGADELHIVGTASVLLAGVGGAVALLLGLGLVGWGLPVRLSSPAFVAEVKLALLWMLPSLPVLLLSSALRGHLEAVGAFRALNLLRAPTGVLLVAGPCLTALYSPDLVWACISILLVRLAHTLALVWLVAREMALRFFSLLLALFKASSTAWLRQLLSFGGWVTVSNVVGPVIIYMDRFVIGAVLAASAVAVYAVPFDVVSRLPVLIASLCSVLLPELARLSRSATDALANIHSVRHLVRQSSMVSLGVVAAVVVVGWLAAPWALDAWLGPAFAQQATLVSQILLLAFGVNALAQIPFTALQATGRVRPVALLHVLELLPYGVAVFLAVSWLGVIGAAWAWLLRSLIDYAVLAWMWHRYSASLVTGSTAVPKGD